MNWLPWKRRTSPDAEVARLAAQADAILAELNLVVKQMSAKLREDTEK
jgi:hypothetical protein